VLAILVNDFLARLGWLNGERETGVKDQELVTDISELNQNHLV
jgi:uncharacterized protein YjbI with pentapeptide repeats